MLTTVQLAASSTASSAMPSVWLTTLTGDQLSIALAAAGLITSIVVAFLQYSIPIWLDNRSYRLKLDIRGDWHSSWTDPSSQKTWTQETCTITIKRGKLVLRGRNNSAGYEWEGEARRHDSGRFIYGTWRSTRPGSNSTGVVMFMVLPQGDLIVGQTFGPDKQGNFRRSEWVMARDKIALNTAREWLKKSSQKFTYPLLGEDERKSGGIKP
jgi:hypothetical protein